MLRALLHNALRCPAAGKCQALIGLHIGLAPSSLFTEASFAAAGKLDVKGTKVPERIEDWQAFETALESASLKGDLQEAIRLCKGSKELLRLDQAKAETLNQIEKHATVLLESAQKTKRLSGMSVLIDFLQTYDCLPSLQHLQDLLHTAIEANNMSSVVKTMHCMEDVQVGPGSGGLLSEDVAVALLHFAAKRRNLRVAIWARQACESLTNETSGFIAERPKLSLRAYLAYISALGACRRMRNAFEMIAEAREAHPDAELEWHSTLSGLVDYMTEDNCQRGENSRTALDLLHQGKMLDPAVPDCIIASYAQAGLMHMAFSTYDLFFDELQLEASTDSYAAILHACVENGAFDSVPLILQEMQQNQIRPSQGVCECLVRFYGRIKDPQGVLRSIEQARRFGFTLSRELLDATHLFPSFEKPDPKRKNTSSVFSASRYRAF